MKFKRVVNVAVGVVMTVVGPSAQAADEANSAKTRINLAGLQRTLSQKVAKAACFAHLLPDEEAYWNEANKARADFSKKLAILVEGDAAQDLAPEQNAEVLEAIQRVSRAWQPIDTKLSQSQGKLTRAEVVSIAAASNEVLDLMNNAVSLIEAAYAGSDTVSPVRARTINVAGFQRTLSQQAAKEFCLLATGSKPSLHQQALADKASAFTQALDQLRNGSGGLEKPAERIAHDLDRLTKTWSRLEPVYERIASGERPTQDEGSFIATQNNRVLTDMNRIVYRYAILK